MKRPRPHSDSAMRMDALDLMLTDRERMPLLAASTKAGEREGDLMKVRDYLQRLGQYQNVTFLIARAVKDDHSPFFHAEYRTTPMRMAKEWLSYNNEPILDSIVLNDKQQPITWLSGADWSGMIRSGLAVCLLVIHQTDFSLMYVSSEQRKHIVSYIEKKLDPAYRKEV